MDKNEYIDKKLNQLEYKINEYLLNNSMNQTLAKRMGADFNSTYDEKYLWNQALFLVTNGCKVLLDKSKNKVSLEAIHVAAQIYENLSYIAEEFDREYCLMLSSFCYDLAGYQANAICLTQELYFLESNINYKVMYENKVLLLVQLFLQKRIQQLLLKSNEFLVELKNEKDIDIDYKEGIKIFFIGMKNISLYVLHGEKSEILEFLELSEFAFLEDGNIFLSLICLLVKTRYTLIEDRSTWANLESKDKLPNNIWERYLSLLSMNMYDGSKIIPINKRRSIFEFWNSQLEAINKGILDSNNGYVVQMPTSAGKTMIAELIILDTLIKYPDKKCIYIAPFRSLSYEIEESLSNSLGKVGYIITDAKGSFEKDEFDDYYLKEADVIISTPEKLNLLMRLNYDFFDNVSLIVVDEGHVLGNRDKRASIIEFLLLRLKRKLKNEARFIFLSAVINTESSKEISNWLCDSDDHIIKSPLDYKSKEWQPTKRIVGKFKWNNMKGTITLPDIAITNEISAFLPNIVSINKYTDYTPKLKKKKTVFFPSINKGKVKKSDTASILAAKYIHQGPVLIYCSTVPNLNGVAKSILEMLRLKEINNETDGLDYFIYRNNLESIEIVQKWMGNCLLKECLSRGIGLHYGNLAEPIKKAIEKDFKNGKLSILISTNTLGQGVNLPIKTIIFHSLVINYNEDVYINKRDFWNIIGRAGRAGKETEGNIIYICNSDFDERLYSYYIDERDTDTVSSVLYVLLKLLIEERLSRNDFNEYLRLFAEPELLTILVEEGLEEIDNDVIMDVLGDSLVKVQAKDMDISILVEELTNLGNRFYTKVENTEMRKSYSKTGFSLQSCEIINSSIEKMIEDNGSDYDIDFDISYNNIFECFSKIEEMQPEKRLLKKLKIWENRDFIMDFVSLWIKGTKLDELKIIWRKYYKDFEDESMDVFIEELLYYKIPWGLTAYNIILACNLEVEMEKMIDEIKYLPVFTKHGLNDIVACWAKSIGVPTRESSILLAKEFHKNNSEREIEIESFIKWFANLSYYELENIIGKDSYYELNNIVNLTQKINSEKFYNKYDLASYCFHIKGIKFDKIRINAANKANINDNIELVRDYNNPYDIYAIKIYSNDKELGFVPRNIAKILAIEIDINKNQYSGRIINKEMIEDNYAIEVEVRKI